MTVTITVAKSAPAPTAPLILPIVFPSVNSQDTGDDYVTPPSPAPTEIVDDPNGKTGEECMEEAKAEGVKVRDFAYEPPTKGRDLRAPELWNDPREALILHDRYIRAAKRPSNPYRLSGKFLHRLRALNWVTQEEAERYWQPEDWLALSEYMSRPLGPYPFCIPKNMKKPTAAYREYLRKEKFSPSVDDIPESQMYVPPDEPGMDDGPERVEPELLRAAAAAISRGQSSRLSTSANVGHADKKRRVGGGEPTGSTTATPQATPPASPSLGAARTLSRTSSASAAPRTSTPPVSVSGVAPRPARGRRRGGLTRTQTFDSIS
ncbi:hypothetical protein BN946_scf185033.g42 [Trametes cinnabarina]|uniref:Uncharacterized protein n=1 Tax=Pycnoporus cinnabarinus TaxID=5643 RepID=A0A060SR71_PYCCI|nr:hypothetical protein BN946_scf185033.g42 [Trametes cinnabarina]